MSAYRWLAGNYTPGDRIWLTGFSRGAYTARSVGGMISRCGLLDLRGPLSDRVVWARVHGVFDAYRRKDTLQSSEGRPFFNTRPGETTVKTTPVHFIGVWDTVGSLGIPDDLALLHILVDPDRHQFHDTDLSTIVAHARHAVAIDEKRQTFRPTLWTKVEDRPTVKQIWFPGVHADVGGGYASSGLSDNALHWMMREMAACGTADADGTLVRPGVAFRPGIIDGPDQNLRGVIHDSITGVFKSLKTEPRAVPGFAAAPALLHSSATDRNSDPPLDQGDYWQTDRLDAGGTVSVDIFARDPWNFTRLFLRAGETYEMEASGEWLDSSIACGPGGTDDGKFQIGEIAQMASSLLGGAETLFKRWTGKQQVDFWWTRRVEDLPWFSLVGVIANDAAPLDKRHSAHQVVAIGNRAPVEPLADGYLYCFANDAWQAYGNNHGSVRLTVRRVT